MRAPSSGLREFYSILRPANACNPTRLSGTCHSFKTDVIRRADAEPASIRVFVATEAEATNARPIASCMLQGRLPERRICYAQQIVDSVTIRVFQSSSPVRAENVLKSFPKPRRIECQDMNEAIPTVACAS